MKSSAHWATVISQLSPTVYMHARFTEQLIYIGLLHVQGVLFEMWVETNSIYY